MQPPADRGVDPDAPASNAASTPTAGGIPGWTPPPWSPDAAAGGIPGWTPPPWSPDAADTRPFWRRIPVGWLIAGALVLVGAVGGWYFTASRSATGEIDKSGDLSVVDLRVGDCFDDKDPSANEIEDVKAVPCTTEHEFELFYVGAMGEGSYPTDDAFETYVTQNCNPAFGAYIGKAYDDSDLDIFSLFPTDDAWRSGDRTVQCAAYHPRIHRLTRSLRGTRQ
jgi:Septum formation